jgi:hypothetical protein
VSGNQGEPAAPTGQEDAAAAFRLLPGDWALSRTVSHGGIVRGRAEFSPRAPRVLHYRESGRLTLSSGYSGEISRQYFYVLEDDHIHVTFADAAPGQRTFLRLRPAAGGSGFHASDTHVCGRDVYAATYGIESQRVVMTIHVSGPREEYVIRTVLTRSPGRSLGRSPGRSQLGQASQPRPRAIRA